MSRKSVAADLQNEESAAVSSPLRRSTRIVNSPAPFSSTISTRRTSSDAAPGPATRSRRGSHDSLKDDKSDKPAPRARRASALIEEEATAPASPKKSAAKSRAKSPSVEKDVVTPKPKGRRSSVTKDPEVAPKAAVTRRRRSSATDIEEPAAEPVKATRSRRSSATYENKDEVEVKKPTTRGRRSSVTKDDAEVEEKKPVKGRRSSTDNEDEPEAKVSKITKSKRRASITENAVVLEVIEEDETESAKVIKVTPIKKKKPESVGADLNLSVIDENEDVFEVAVTNGEALRRSPRLTESPSKKTEETTKESPTKKSPAKTKESPMKNKDEEKLTSPTEKDDSPVEDKNFSMGSDGSFRFKLNVSIPSSASETLNQESTEETRDELNSSKSSNESDKENSTPIAKKAVEKEIVVTLVKARASDVFRPQSKEFSFLEPMDVDVTINQTSVDISDIPAKSTPKVPERKRSNLSLKKSASDILQHMDDDESIDLHISDSDEEVEVVAVTKPRKSKSPEKSPIKDDLYLQTEQAKLVVDQPQDKINGKEETQVDAQLDTKLSKSPAKEVESEVVEVSVGSELVDAAVTKSKSPIKEDVESKKSRKSGGKKDVLTKGGEKTEESHQDSILIDEFEFAKAAESSLPEEKKVSPHKSPVKPNSETEVVKPVDENDMFDELEESIIFTNAKQTQSKPEESADNTAELTAKKNLTPKKPEETKASVLTSVLISDDDSDSASNLPADEKTKQSPKKDLGKLDEEKSEPAVKESVEETNKETIPKENKKNSPTKRSVRDRSISKERKRTSEANESEKAEDTKMPRTSVPISISKSSLIKSANRLETLIAPNDEVIECLKTNEESATEPTGKSPRKEDGEKEESPGTLKRRYDLRNKSPSSPATFKKKLRSSKFFNDSNLIDLTDTTTATQKIYNSLVDTDDDDEIAIVSSPVKSDLKTTEETSESVEVSESEEAETVSPKTDSKTGKSADEVVQSEEDKSEEMEVETASVDQVEVAETESETSEVVADQGIEADIVSPKRKSHTRKSPRKSQSTKSDEDKSDIEGEIEPESVSPKKKLLTKKSSRKSGSKKSEEDKSDQDEAEEIETASPKGKSPSRKSLRKSESKELEEDAPETVAEQKDDELQLKTVSLAKVETFIKTSHQSSDEEEEETVTVVDPDVVVESEDETSSPKKKRKSEIADEKDKPEDQTSSMKSPKKSVKKSALDELDPRLRRKSKSKKEENAEKEDDAKAAEDSSSESQPEVVASAEKTETKVEPERKMIQDIMNNARLSRIESFANSKLDEFLANKFAEMENETYTDEDEEVESDADSNSFIDGMAIEGEEDTPSEGSNDIVDEGESINTTDSESESDIDDAYENDSFVCSEEEVALLSGDEYDLGDELKKKKSRILQITLNESTDIITIPKKIKPEKPKKPSRLVPVSADSSDEELKDEIRNLSEVQSDSEEIEEEPPQVVTAEVKQSAEKPVASPSVPEASTSQEADEEMPQSEAETSVLNSSENSQRRRKRNSSIIIQENIQIDDTKDSALSSRISDILDSFCSTIQKGEISVNISLEYAEENSDEEVAKPSEDKTIERRLSVSADNVEGLATKLPKKRLSSSLENVDSKSKKKKTEKIYADLIVSKSNLSDKKGKNKSVGNFRTDTFSIMNEVISDDLKNRPRRAVKPTTLNDTVSWSVTDINDDMKPSTSLVTKKYHAKDFKNQMLYNSKRVARIDTKSLLKKRGV